MRKPFFPATSTLFLALFTGCGASGPVYKPTQVASVERAVVYVYRPKTFYNWGGSPEIFVDGVEKFPMEMGGYGVLELIPGRYELKIEGSLLLDNWYPKPASTTINVERGKEYYIRTGPVFDGAVLIPGGAIPRGHAEIVQVPSELGKQEIATMKLSQ